MKEKLRQLIAKGRTEKALQLLLEITKELGDEDLREEALLQSSKYEQYAREKRLGTSSSEVQRMAIAQINQALAYLVRQLPDEWLEKNYPNYKDTEGPSAEGAEPESSLINEGLVSPVGMAESLNPSNSGAMSGKATLLNRKTLWKWIVGLGIVVGIFAGFSQIGEVTLKDFFSSPSLESNTVTVLAHSPEGKDQLVLPNRGIVQLIYGDAKVHEPVNKNGVATFRQVPSQFFEPDAKVEILFQDPEGEPYRAVNPDSLYALQRGQYIGLEVQLLGMDKIHGVVKDFVTERFLPGATVRVSGVDAVTNEYGEFALEFPREVRRQFVTIRAFKEGYRDYELSNVPTTTGREIVIMMKPVK